MGVHPEMRHNYRCSFVQIKDAIIDVHIYKDMITENKQKYILL